jgi:hypothetical protein
MDCINHTKPSEVSYEWGRAIEALMWLRYNHGSERALEMAYGPLDEKAPKYLDEKRARWKRCPLSFFAGLDRGNRCNFIERLLRMYGDPLERS